MDNPPIAIIKGESYKILQFPDSKDNVDLVKVKVVGVFDTKKGEVVEYKYGWINDHKFVPIKTFRSWLAQEQLL